ncbi:LysM peptidoglycan-binding domain-containing protein [Nitriliruptor alkaliphilus]|uniref:LysM peptidoglycan-binding domain-containing protein n=1 Tax=Nitriliruptor alkaliphilus TaxID=427918 RepID=UPI000696F476|nr:LysM peptidoglycan-binding domain-containing protein [Nitriliruptor alkaliphilus]
MPDRGVVVAAARGIVRLMVWCAALAMVLVALHRLPVPADALDLASREPADLMPVLLRGARWIALACAWYLAGATTLSTVTTVLAWRPLRRLEDAVTLPVVRRLVHAGLGASLVVGVGLGPATVAAATPGPPGVAPGPPGASGAPAPLAELRDPPVDDPPRAPRIAELPGPRAPDVAEPTRDEDEPPLVAPTRAEADVDLPASGVATHEVVPGESFWSIAADLTADEFGREPEDGEIFERWIALIEVNRDRLLIPDDPDLLLPGQQLRLPGGGR